MDVQARGARLAGELAESGRELFLLLWGELVAARDDNGQVAQELVRPVVAEHITQLQCGVAASDDRCEVVRLEKAV